MWALYMSFYFWIVYTFDFQAIRSYQFSDVVCKIMFEIDNRRNIDEHGKLIEAFSMK